MMKNVVFLLLAFVTSNSFAETELERGEYLTTILGCGGCHSEGALMGEPTGPWLAGSRTGVAFSEDAEGNPTGIVFPSNLTSDRKTGIGDWSVEDIQKFLLTGVGHDGLEAIPVMPWPNYRLLKPEDIRAIAVYLKSVPPVERQIPGRIFPGDTIDQPYVRIGVYLFQPDPQPESDKP